MVPLPTEEMVVVVVVVVVVMGTGLMSLFGGYRSSGFLINDIFTNHTVNGLDDHRE